MAPRIQEYQPEQNAAGPQGATSPNLEAIGQLGQGIERFGGAVTEVADKIEARAAMMESADAQQQVSEQKSEFFDRIKDETNRGVLDQNKLFDDYNQWYDKTSGDFSTGRGKAEFERAAGRTRGAIIRWAAQGSAQIAGANALANHTNVVNNLTDLTQKDPHSYPDNVASLLEMYDGYKNDPNMNKNPMALEKMKQTELGQMASAAVHGQMDMDYNNVVNDMVASGGRVNPADAKYNIAKGMLDSGVYDDHLNSQSKVELTKNIRSNFNAAQTEGQRIIKLQEDQQQAQVDDKMAKAYPQIVAGTYSVKQAMQDFKGDAKAMDHAVNLIRKQQEPSVMENSPAFNHIMDRINSDETSPGHISTATQIRDAMAQSNIPPRYYGNFASRIDKSPEGEAQRGAEKSLMDFAKKRLESIDIGGVEMVGQKNQYAGVQLRKFTLALDEAKKQAIKDGLPISSVFDPSNPKSMYRRVEEFHLPADEVLKQLSGTTTKTQFPGPSEQPAPAAPAKTTIQVRDSSGKTFQASPEWLKAHPKSGYEATGK